MSSSAPSETARPACRATERAGPARRWGPPVIVVLVATMAAGCQPADYVYGFNVTGDTFVLYNENVGIHPHQDVLLDPNNPFREYGVGEETKWEILAAGGNVATFYAWSTTLVSQATGENQFYTGTALQGIYEIAEAPEEDLPTIRNMAIRAYQTVLDEFPESVTYDASGERPTRLATYAYNRILDLGGRVQGDWVLVETAGGGTEAVRSSSVDPGREDGEGS